MAYHRHTAPSLAVSQIGRGQSVVAHLDEASTRRLERDLDSLWPRRGCPAPEAAAAILKDSAKRDLLSGIVRRAAGLASLDSGLRALQFAGLWPVTAAEVPEAGQAVHRLCRVAVRAARLAYAVTDLQEHAKEHAKDKRRRDAWLYG